MIDCTCLDLVPRESLPDVKTMKSYIKMIESNDGIGAYYVIPKLDTVFGRMLTPYEEKEALEYLVSKYV